MARRPSNTSACKLAINQMLCRGWEKVPLSVLPATREGIVELRRAKRSTRHLVWTAKQNH